MSKPVKSTGGLTLVVGSADNTFMASRPMPAASAVAVVGAAMVLSLASLADASAAPWTRVGASEYRLQSAPERREASWLGCLCEAAQQFRPDMGRLGLSAAALPPSPRLAFLDRPLVVRQSAPGFARPWIVRLSPRLTNLPPPNGALFF